MPSISSENVRWRLKQVHSGQIFDVNKTDNYMVGRSQTAQISLNSSKASRRHSSFVVNVEGHLLVADLKSVNGTFVNGTQISVYVLHRVFPGDIIGFGVANMDLSENDRDKQTFFTVIHDELPIQNNPLVEASLADSTSDVRENEGLNSPNSNQCSAINSTAEIRVNPVFELPSIPKQDPIDIIDITSSIDDDEIFDLELDDCLGDDNQPHLIMEDIPAVSDRSLQRKQINSKNCLQKQLSSKGQTRRSDNLRDIRFEESIRDVTTSQQVKNSFRTYTGGNNIQTNSDTIKTVSTHITGPSDIVNSHLIVDNHDAKMAANISLRRKSLALPTPGGHADNNRKPDIRRKSVAGEPSYIMLRQEQVEEQPNRKKESLKKSKNKEKPKESAAVSRRTSTKGLDMSGNEKKLGDKPFSKPQRKSWAGDANMPKDSCTKISKQAEIPVKKGSGDKSFVDNENNKDTRAEASRNTSLGNIDHSEKNKAVNKLDKDELLKGTSKVENYKSDENFLFKIKNVISGKYTLSHNTLNNKNNPEQKTERFKDERNKKCHTQKNESEGVIGIQPPHNHKKVKMDDCAEFTVSHNLSSSKDKEPEESSLFSKDLILNGNPKERIKQYMGTTIDIENDHKLQNKHEEDQIEYVVQTRSSRNTSGENLRREDENLSFTDPSSRNNKCLEKSFTTNKDNSVIIDITDEDEDIDFSCSQIFHMSQIVKSETQDDAFQKIKNELAEMEFCEAETIVNRVPINVDNDMSGFENTQDICACLEDGVQENENANEFVSNEDNEELINILGDLDKDADNDVNTPYADDMEVSVDESILPNIDNNKSSAEETSYDKIDCVTFFGKPKYVKPPLVEPHSITKPKKDPPKKSPSKQYIQVNKEETKATKRKNSLETPAKKKKLKGSPRCVAEPPRCDVKSIQHEFKKRNSGSKVEQDTSAKNNIREERRKKLKEISERSASLKATETRCGKGNTVKVLPESKTRRGSYLLEEPKKSRGDVMKSKSNKNPSVLKDLVVNESSNSKKNIRKENKNAHPNVVCKCLEPGRSDHQMPCQVHTKNFNNKETIRKNPGRSLDTNENHSSLKDSSRPKTPNTELGGYRLKLLEFPVSSNYNLRRTKSSGDIKADLQKSNDQPRTPQTRYNLRHSSALEHNQEDPRHKVDITASNKHAVPPYPGGVPFRPPPLNQTSKHGLPSRTNQMNKSEAVCYNTNPVTSNEMSRRLMWTNGGPSNTRRAPVRRLPNVDEVVKKMVNWLPNWLTEQVNIDYSAPVNNPPAGNIPLHFNNFEQYHDTFSKLVLLENWQYLFKGFREGAEQPRKVKIQHVRVANELTTMDCVCYISQKELRQGLFYKPEDFVLLEFVVNDQSNSYISVNFGFIQRSKKSIISNNDFIVVKLGDFCNGEPHAKLEFSIVTRYQPGKEITMKKYPIVKVLANIRAHLMMIRAIKVLVDSPLCSKILHPKINEYKFPVTHRDIIQPHSLNSQQRSIVLEAASLCTGNGPGIYCIKGPPGTGKSTVIVNLVMQILFSHYVTKKTQKPPMILLAAPSNTAVDNLLSKLTDFKHSLGSEWDKNKANVKCVRIGPESSISKELVGYSLPKLAEKHIPLKHMDVPEFRAAWEKNRNLLEFAKTFFGDRYGYEIKACEDLIIQKSNIICTTLNSCINGKLIEAVNRGLIQFTCCIIDEATQCHEVEALLPTILGIDKIVLVGDPKQLNATIMNRDAFKLGFGESLFSRIGNNFVNDPRTPIKMLTEQYRMHPEICAFPNKHFYEGKLRSLAKPANKLPEKIRPYLVFNCEKINDSSDYTNIDEVNLIKKLLSTIFGMLDGNHKYTVGIITPYNAQKDLINRNVMELASKNSHFKITVNTVDSFQGSENDIIIISCVRDSTNSFLQNEHRLNVALTRAKQALYIVGNYTLFKECKTLYDLREDAKKRKLLLDIRQDPNTIDNFSRYLIKRNSTE